MIEAEMVDVIVSVGTNMFMNATLSCTLWFFDKRKVGTDRQNKILFINIFLTFFTVTNLAAVRQDIPSNTGRSVTAFTDNRKIRNYKRCLPLNNPALFILASPFCMFLREIYALDDRPAGNGINL